MNDTTVCGSTPVPEGQLTIAQGFSPGYRLRRELVPKGRLSQRSSAVPSGLIALDAQTQG